MFSVASSEGLLRWCGPSALHACTGVHWTTSIGQTNQLVCLQVNIRVECTIAKDTLKGDDVTELHLKLLSQEAESYPFKDDD